MSQPGAPIFNPVKVRNFVRLQHAREPDDAKILFSSRRLYNPADVKPLAMRGYTLDAHYIRFANIGFGLFNVDIYGLGLVGLESSDASAFPVVAGLVDSTPSSTQLAALAVSDLTGKDLLITFEKAEVTRICRAGVRAASSTRPILRFLRRVRGRTICLPGSIKSGTQRSSRRRDYTFAMPFLRAIPTAGSMPSNVDPATCSTSGRSSSSSGNSFRYMSGVRRCRTREAYVPIRHPSFAASLRLRTCVHVK